MPHFRVDDNFHAHRKVAKLGVDGIDAIGLWTLAGSWSADQLSDGWVPEYVAARLDPGYADRAAKLVRVGLWQETERDGERGWLFNGWSEPGRNLTSEQVKAERAATADRQRRFRNRVKGTGAPTERTDDRNAVTNASVTDPRNGAVTDPLPFLSLPTEEVLRTSSLPPRKRAAAATKGTRIPDDFTLTDDMRTWGQANHPTVDGERETAAFIDYWRSTPGAKGVKLDWQATWRNWIRRAADRAPAPANGHMPRTSTADQRVQAGLQLAAKHAAEDGVDLAALMHFPPRRELAG